MYSSIRGRSNREALEVLVYEAVEVLVYEAVEVLVPQGRTH